MNKALIIIEEAYGIAINPEQDYLSQLQPLAPNGELANKLTSNTVLFKLCMLVDAQEKEIQSLKEDRVQIAQKMLELEEKVNPSVKTIAFDPSKPLDDTAITQTGGSNTDSII